MFHHALRLHLQTAALRSYVICQLGPGCRANFWKRHRFTNHLELLRRLHSACLQPGRYHIDLLSRIDLCCRLLRQIHVRLSQDGVGGRCQLVVKSMSQLFSEGWWLARSRCCLGGVLWSPICELECGSHFSCNSHLAQVEDLSA